LPAAATRALTQPSKSGSPCRCRVGTIDMHCVRCI
jgi:hypothetical protein